MRIRAVVFLIFCLSTVSLATEPKTMRLDYYHTGNTTQEFYSVDRVVIEPLAWPGHPKNNIDEGVLGKYRFEIADKKSGKLIFARGFDSIYGEWVTTAEAKTANRTFHESLRFPTPDAPVEITLRKRDAHNKWQKAWNLTLDPKDMFVDPALPPSPGELIEIVKNGPSSDKVDVLIIGDGYTQKERGKFEADAKRMIKHLFAASPFKERATDFNVWGLCPPAAESGVSRPSTGIHRASPLGTSYDIFRIERYALTFDNKSFRNFASFAPYEFVEILMNGQTYGGGGIFGLYSTVAVDNTWAPYVFVHEFGHHFVGLADEYYTSDVAYLPPAFKVEPWEPNVTALLDPKTLKWKDLVSADTPLPTPWNKDEYEDMSRGYQRRRKEIRKDQKPETEMDQLAKKNRRSEESLLREEKYAGKVGAFEGANYATKGYYRPEANCIMFTKTDFFCSVCKRALTKQIDFYSRSGKQEEKSK